MKQLESLCNEAAQQVSPPMPIQLTLVENEVSRQMQICNACRYCEGFCAVFPAMTRRLDFSSPDIHYLANLCHNCGACLHACQYAPPHEFGVNVPKAMAAVRGETYANYSWPRAMGALYKRNGLFVALTIAACLSLFLLLAVAATGQLIHDPLAGDFYAIFPHNLMASLFGAVSLFVALSMGIGAFRFWRDIKLQRNSVPATAEAAKNALGLNYLGGGHGDGCNEEDDRFTLARRWFHHFTFYGFMLCFASTIVGTIYHYFMGQAAPYPILSLPVLLGTVGGIGLLIGPAGLLWLNYRRHPRHGDPKQRPMDRGFILLLLLTSASGLALLVWRDTGAMAILLAIHLGIVLALFLTLPYGKFVHGLYRCVALLKWSIERRLPNEVGVGAD